MCAMSWNAGVPYTKSRDAVWGDCFLKRCPSCLQTGSGKTHTLLGDLHHAQHRGIVPRAVSALAAGLVVSASPSCSVQVPPDHAAMHGCQPHACATECSQDTLHSHPDTRQCLSAGLSVAGMQPSAILLSLGAGI